MNFTSATADPSEEVAVADQTAKICTTTACTQRWALSGLHANANKCVQSSVSIAFTIDGNGYTGISGSTVQVSFNINTCLPTQDDTVELPTPTAVLELYSDPERTHDTRVFVHGRKIYGDLRLQDCDTYALGIEKIETVCAATEEGW